MLQNQIKSIIFKLSGNYLNSPEETGVKQAIMAELFLLAVKNNLVDDGNYSELVEESKAVIAEASESADYKRAETILSSIDPDIDTYIQVADAYVQMLNKEHFRNIEATPAEISKLACRLLEIEDGNSVYDLGSGSGEFLAAVSDYARKERINVFLTGSEIQNDKVFLSKIVLALRNANYRIDNEDSIKDDDSHTYSRAYVFPPFGLRYGEDYTDSFNQKYGELFNTRSHSEWYFVMKALSHLDDKGVLVALVPEGTLFRSTDKNIRKYLLERKLLQGIISLPARILEGTGVKCDLVVIGPSDGTFKAVNAVNMIIPSRDKRIVRIDSDAIYNAYMSDDVKLIDYEDAKDKDYNLDLNVYSDINVKEMIDSPVDISEVASVIVGTQYTSARFKDSFSDVATDYQILTSGNIENGLIDYSSLQYINNDEKLDKFALKEGDLVVTTKSTKVKTAVATGLPDHKIIVTGGMLIVRTDKEKLNPTYLKMYLDSEIGQAVLRTIQKGAIITTISVSEFKHILVSCPPMEKQEKLADKYDSLLSMYGALQQQMKDTELKINSLYDNSMKGED